MQQRDPGRSFVLGERLQYVLLPGLRTQDEAAEDPLTAVLAGQQADFELYWKNKLLRPLSELFAVCLNPAQLHALLSGLHPCPLLPCFAKEGGGGRRGSKTPRTQVTEDNCQLGGSVPKHSAQAARYIIFFFFHTLQAGSCVTLPLQRVFDAWSG